MSKKRKKQDDRQDALNPAPAKSRKLFYLIIALVISIAINAAFAYRYYALSSSMDSLYTQLSDLAVRLEDCTANQSSMQEDAERNRMLLDSKLMAAQMPFAGEFPTNELDILRKRGLRNPIEDIQNDLFRHKELIPFKAPTGREQKFSSVDAIHLLSRHFVFARFTDGRRTGHMVLEFKVNEGRITWEVLGAYQD